MVLVKILTSIFRGNNMMKRVVLIFLLSLSLYVTGCSVVKPNEGSSESFELNTVEQNNEIEDSEIEEKLEYIDVTETEEELDSEVLKIGDVNLTIFAKDSSSKLKLLEDVVMMLDVTNNATVYYQDTGVPISESNKVLEDYILAWACNSGNVMLGEEVKESESPEENITSINISDEDINFFYRFSDDGHVDIYLAENISLDNYLGIHIYGEGENLDDVVALIKEYLM